jgi:surface polysaccharide O-acyltransferase-like enzyme
MMPQEPDHSDQAMAAPARIVPLDRARTFIILLVLLHHSVVNYTYFGTGDRMRWLGFDLIVLFNDSFFMAFMFLVSGLFVHDSVRRKGAAVFLRNRGWRLGMPLLLSIFVLIPVAYYPTFLRYHLPETTDLNFLHFWWRTVTIGPWPSGPSWFLWVLLALDLIVAVVWRAAQGAIEALGRLIFSLRDRPMTAFASFLLFSIAAYLPMHLIFGDDSWFEPGRFPFPIQTSRIFLYAGYFLVGIGVGAVNLRTGLLAEQGALARRWPVWLGFALVFYGAILALVYIHHNWVANFNSPPLSWRAAYGLAFSMFSAAMAFTVPAILLHFAKSGWRLLDALQPSAYGVYLLHYIFIIWLQYAVYDASFHAGVKFAIVFSGTLAMSWTLTLLLRRIPAVRGMI